MPPVIDSAKCVRCGLCIKICPMGLFRTSPQEAAPPEVAFPDECWHCNSCVLDCPRQAVTLRIPISFMLLHVDAAQLHAGKE